QLASQAILHIRCPRVVTHRDQSVESHLVLARRFGVGVAARRLIASLDRKTEGTLRIAGSEEMSRELGGERAPGRDAERFERVSNPPVEPPSPMAGQLFVQGLVNQ